MLTSSSPAHQTHRTYFLGNIKSKVYRSDPLSESDIIKTIKLEIPHCLYAFTYWFPLSPACDMSVKGIFPDSVIQLKCFRVFVALFVFLLFFQVNIRTATWINIWYLWFFGEFTMKTVAIFIRNVRNAVVIKITKCCSWFHDLASTFNTYIHDFIPFPWRIWSLGIPYCFGFFNRSFFM